MTFRAELLDRALVVRPRPLGVPRDEWLFAIMIASDLPGETIDAIAGFHAQRANRLRAYLRRPRSIA